MIDHTVHHTYIIKVRFYINLGKGEELRACVFTSNHDCNSEHFDAWAQERVKKVEGFTRFDEKKYAQHEVLLENFCE